MPGLSVFGPDPVPGLTAQTRTVVSVIAAGAVGTHVAATRWMLGSLSRRPGVRAQVLELRDFPLPLWAPRSPVLPALENEVVARWRSAIDCSDGFILHVPPEHDAGAQARLMEAIEWAYPAWRDKAAALVSVCDHSGWRAIQQLRAKAASLRMIVARSELRMPAVTRSVRCHCAEEPLDELLWLAEMLQAMREERHRARRAHQHSDHPYAGQGDGERR
jgi:NAD(P)H-dependent FMN reductase